MPQNVKMFGKLSTGEEEEGKTRRFAAKVKMFVKPPSGLQREQLRLRAGFCLRNIFVTFFQRRINDNIYLMVIHLCFTWHNDADLVGNRRFFIRYDRIPWSMTPHCKAELFSHFRAKGLNKIYIEKPDMKGLKRFENISPKEFTCLSFIAFFREFQQNSRIAT